jgi:transcriptional regulator with XRE-family HTH domain
VLRHHRQEQKRTLAEVARDACVSVPYLSEVERGRRGRRALLVEQGPAPVIRLDTARRGTRMAGDLRSGHLPPRRKNDGP